MTDYFDPFDDAPADNAPQTEEPDLSSETEAKPAPKPRAPRKTKKETVVDDEARQSKMSITMKGGSGYDAPWVVLYPDSLEEAEELLGEENRELLKSVLKRTQQASQYFMSQAPSTPDQGSNGASQSGGRPGAPQGAQEHPEGRVEYCEHGKMRYKTGVAGPNAKNPGRPYKMFVCTGNVPREQQCKPKSA